MSNYQVGDVVELEGIGSTFAKGRWTVDALTFDGRLVLIGGRLNDLLIVRPNQVRPYRPATITIPADGTVYFEYDPVGHQLLSVVIAEDNFRFDLNLERLANMNGPGWTVDQIERAIRVLDGDTGEPNLVFGEMDLDIPA
jgi:hypothetical protein